MISASPVFQRLATDLCSSVSNFVRQTMSPVSPLLRGTSVDYVGSFGPSEVELRYGPSEKTFVRVEDAQNRFVFRQSKHIPGALVIEREQTANSTVTVSCSLERRGKDISPIQVLFGVCDRSSGSRLGFRMMPRLSGGDDAMMGLQVISEAVDFDALEPDFCTSLSGYESVLENMGHGAFSCVNAREGLWRGLAEAADEGDSLRGLETAELDKGYLLGMRCDVRSKRIARRIFGVEPDRLQLSGWTCTSLVSLIQCLKLVAVKGGRVIRTFPE